MLSLSIGQASGGPALRLRGVRTSPGTRSHRPTRSTRSKPPHVVVWCATRPLGCATPPQDRAFGAHRQAMEEYATAVGEVAIRTEEATAHRDRLGRMWRAWPRRATTCQAALKRYLRDRSDQTRPMPACEGICAQCLQVTPRPCAPAKARSVSPASSGPAWTRLLSGPLERALKQTHCRKRSPRMARAQRARIGSDIPLRRQTTAEAPSRARQLLAPARFRALIQIEPMRSRAPSRPCARLPSGRVRVRDVVVK